MTIPLFKLGLACTTTVAALMSTIVALDTIFPSKESSKSWTKEEVMECVVLYESAIENETVKTTKQGNIANSILKRLTGL